MTRERVDGTLPGEVDAPVDWSDLSLAELRGYRGRLTHEEERISYWRRLVHARLDMLAAEADQARPLHLDELVRVLGDTGSGRTRSALLRVAAADPLPELPALEEMWISDLDPTDHGAVAEATQRLRDAESKLTDYRRALHRRLDEATAELIARYRRNPISALVALEDPHTRPVGGR
ncbi:MAG: hypothetical protein ACRDPB_09880 [Nocardioidaceae bacterium]